MASIRSLVGMCVAAALLVPCSSHAVFIGNSQGGTDFPQGAVSFADSVETYSVGGGGVTSPHQVPSNAVGLPDYAGSTTCTAGSCPYVSLGDGGSIVLRFVDNRLTGSGTSALDLWVFEVGPDVEDTFVAISKDGITFTDVGKVFGSTAGIDIDAFGFGPSDEFAFVRLTDDTNEGGQTGATAGADIDAVGAISTVRRTVPEPGTLALLGLGIAGLVNLRRRS